MRKVTLLPIGVLLLCVWSSALSQKVNKHKAMPPDFSILAKKALVWDVYKIKPYSYGAWEGNMIVPACMSSDSLWYLYDVKRNKLLAEISFSFISDFYQKDSIIAIYGVRAGRYVLYRLLDDNTTITPLDSTELAAGLSDVFDDNYAVAVGLKSGTDTITRYLSWDKFSFSIGQPATNYILYHWRTGGDYKVYLKSTKKYHLYSHEAPGNALLTDLDHLSDAAWHIRLTKKDNQFSYYRTGTPQNTFTDAIAFNRYACYTYARRDSSFFVLDTFLNEISCPVSKNIDSIFFFDSPGRIVLIRSQPTQLADCKTLWSVLKVNNLSMDTLIDSMCVYHLLAVDSNYILRQEKNAGSISLYDVSKKKFIGKLYPKGYDLKRASVTILPFVKNARVTHYYLLNVWNIDDKGFDQYLFNHDEMTSLQTGGAAPIYKYNAANPSIFSYKGQKGYWHWINLEPLYREWRNSKYKAKINDLVNKYRVCTGCNITRLNAFTGNAQTGFYATGISYKDKEKNVVVDSERGPLNNP